MTDFELLGNFPRAPPVRKMSQDGLFKRRQPAGQRRENVARTGQSENSALPGGGVRLRPFVVIAVEGDLAGPAFGRVHTPARPNIILKMKLAALEIPALSLARPP